MKTLSAFVAGILATLLFVQLTKRESPLTTYLGLSDAELIARKSEIDRLDGGEGKAIQALLACIGYRMASEAVREKAVVQLREKLTPEPPAKTPARAVPSTFTTPPASGETPAVNEINPLDRVPPKSSSTTPTPDGRHFFCSALLDNPVAMNPDAKWLHFFPVAPKTSASPLPLAPAIQGWFDEATDQTTEAFLDSRLCKQPSLGEFSDGPRKQNEFFKRLRRKVYAGHLRLDKKWRTPPVRMHFHFNWSDQDPIGTYWFLAQHDGKQARDVLENRYSVDGDNLRGGVWRPNACSGAITLLNDQCALAPVAAEYDLEYKDFFFLADRNELAGNYYCRRRSDKTWVRLGGFMLRPGGP